MLNQQYSWSVFSVVLFSVQSLLKEPVQRQKKKKPPRKRKYCSEDEDEEDEQDSSSSSSSDEDDEIIRRPKKSSKSQDSDSDSDMEDVDKVMDRLPEHPGPLLDFANASQGVLLLLVLKQHLKNLYGFSDR